MVISVPDCASTSYVTSSMRLRMTKMPRPAVRASSKFTGTRTGCDTAWRPLSRTRTAQHVLERASHVTVDELAVRLVLNHRRARFGHRNLDIFDIVE